MVDIPVGYNIVTLYCSNPIGLLVKRNPIVLIGNICIIHIHTQTHTFKWLEILCCHLLHIKFQSWPTWNISILNGQCMLITNSLKYTIYINAYAWIYKYLCISFHYTYVLEQYACWEFELAIARFYKWRIVNDIITLFSIAVFALAKLMNVNEDQSKLSAIARFLKFAFVDMIIFEWPLLLVSLSWGINLIANAKLFFT